MSRKLNGVGLTMKLIEITSKAKAEEAIRLHAEQAKAANRCEQCQHPWHDGLCDCVNPDAEWASRCDDMLIIYWNIWSSWYDGDVRITTEQDENE